MVEINLKNLTKSFGEEVVIDKLNLTVKPGELVALLGPSGCGKTTTLKLISGLLAPDKGDILFNSSSVVDIPTETRGAVLVFQDYLLFPHLDVAENIAFGLKMQGDNKETRRKRVKELLELVNLEGYEDNYPQELSGGQKQRIALARALAVNPKVLLLDEPLTNLDANLRGEMQEFIRSIHLEEEMTTLFVTHDRDEAMLIADKIAVMNEGEIEQFGTAEELYKQPKTKFVSDFFGAANYIKGEVKGNKVIFPEGELSIDSKLAASGINLTEGQQIRVMVRPEFIKPTPKFEADKFQIKGTVCQRKFVGERIRYRVDDGKQILEVTTLPPSPIKEGDEIYLNLDRENIWLMEW